MPQRCLGGFICAGLNAGGGGEAGSGASEHSLSLLRVEEHKARACVWMPASHPLIHLTALLLEHPISLCCLSFCWHD